jgi:hypothetical protein
MLTSPLVMRITCMTACPERAYPALQDIATGRAGMTTACG